MKCIVYDDNDVLYIEKLIIFNWIQRCNQKLDKPASVWKDTTSRIQT